MADPRVIPRAEHSLSRRDVDPDALKVLYRLHQADHIAYLVGGGVRDLLLSRRPKDFDIGTSAHPQQVKKLFRNCWIIGRRFRLAHVKFGNKVIEVATFRRQLAPGEEVVADGVHDLAARVVRSIGDPETRIKEDPVRMLRAIALASRLDFTIDPPLAKAIRLHRHEIVKSSPPRVLEEYYKILRAGSAERTFRSLADVGLLEPISTE